MQATTVQSGSPAGAASGTTTPPDFATVVITNADGTQTRLPVPMNRAEVNALRSQRSELSDQLISATDRRHELSEELKSAPAGASRTGLEARIAVLDKRIVQLETDIASTGRQLSATPLMVLNSAETGGGGGGGDDIPENVAAISGAFIALILFPLTIVLARNLWRRGSTFRAPAQQLTGDSGQRLERLEQGMEAIAIEIERVAEGQRFVTRLLSEGHAGESVSINRSMERSSTS
jgi:hypothetical protein